MISKEKMLREKNIYKTKEAFVYE